MWVNVEKYVSLVKGAYVHLSQYTARGLRSEKSRLLRMIIRRPFVVLYSGQFLDVFISMSCKYFFGEFCFPTSELQISGFILCNCTSFWFFKTHVCELDYKCLVYHQRKQHIVHIWFQGSAYSISLCVKCIPLLLRFGLKISLASSLSYYRFTPNRIKGLRAQKSFQTPKKILCIV